MKTFWAGLYPHQLQIVTCHYQTEKSKLVFFGCNKKHKRYIGQVNSFLMRAKYFENLKQARVPTIKHLRAKSNDEKTKQLQAK